MKKEFILDVYKIEKEVLTNPKLFKKLKKKDIFNIIFLNTLEQKQIDSLIKAQKVLNKL